MLTHRNLPNISRLNRNASPRQSRAEPQSCRSHFTDEDLEAHTLAKAYEQVKSSSNYKSKKMRKIFNSLMKIIRNSLCDKFGQQLGLQLSEITNRMVYLVEAQNSSICQSLEKREEEKKSHEHPSPEYKVLIYECLRRDYENWNKEKEEINKEIERTNLKIQSIAIEWNQKLKAKEIRQMNQILKIRAEYRQGQSSGEAENLKQSLSMRKADEQCGSKKQEPIEGKRCSKVADRLQNKTGHDRGKKKKTITLRA